MITPIGEPNERNLSRTITEINEGMPRRKTQTTPFNLKFHDIIMDAFPLRLKASFGIVNQNYMYRHMREFVKRHGGYLYDKVYFRDFKQKHR